MVLELVLVVEDWAVVVVHDGPVVELWELLDVIRVVVLQIWCMLNYMIVELHGGDVLHVVELVVQLGVEAWVFVVLVDAIHGQVLVG